MLAEELEALDYYYHLEPYTHRYPTCWRCKTELVFRLVDEWFISMGELYDKPREQVTAEEKENSLRYQIMDVVDQIDWYPSFGYERELDWLHTMSDWMISKKRYWGLALPIWVCEKTGYTEAVANYDDLLAKPGVAGTDVWEKAKAEKVKAEQAQAKAEAARAMAAEEQARVRAVAAFERAQASLEAAEARDNGDR